MLVVNSTFGAKDATKLHIHVSGRTTDYTVSILYRYVSHWRQISTNAKIHTHATHH